MGAVSGALAGMGLLAILVIVVIGIAIGALLLSVAYRLVVGYMPSYLRAMGAVVLTGIASAIVIAIAHAVLGSGGRLLGIVVQFLVGAAMVNWLLLSATGVRVGYGRACLVQLVFTVIEIVVGVVLAIMAVTLFGLGIASMHG